MLTVDLATTTGENEIIWHINGEVQNVVQGDWGVDGRFSLYATDDVIADWFFIFADNNGDQADFGLVSSFQFRDTAMTPDEVAALGGPTASGIPEPDPITCAFTRDIPCEIDNIVYKRSTDGGVTWSAPTGQWAKSWFADGITDGVDFILWNQNKFMSSGGVSAVPEPTTVVVLFAAVLGLAVVRQR